MVALEHMNKNTPRPSHITMSCILEGIEDKVCSICKQELQWPCAIPCEHLAFHQHCVATIKERLIVCEKCKTTVNFHFSLNYVGLHAALSFLFFPIQFIFFFVITGSVAQDEITDPIKTMACTLAIMNILQLSISAIVIAAKDDGYKHYYSTIDYAYGSFCLLLFVMWLFIYHFEDIQLQSLSITLYYMSFFVCGLFFIVKVFLKLPLCLKRLLYSSVFVKLETKLS